MQRSDIHTEREYRIVYSVVLPLCYMALHSNIKIGLNEAPLTCVISYELFSI